ncbi:MAG: response regulator [Methanoregula sp.]|nr:response regulator [Methanoregula sp.]
MDTTELVAIQVKTVGNGGQIMKDILIVDDDSSIISTFRQILEMEGYTIETAESGTQALSIAQETSFYLALLDIKLPDIDGTILLAEIKKIRPSMKCIMVTGFASLENAIKAVNSGAAGYITKPVRPEDLVKKVREKLEERKAEEDIQGEQVTEWIEDQFLRLS